MRNVFTVVPGNVVPLPDEIVETAQLEGEEKRT
jgi:hypothetical protein